MYNMVIGIFFCEKDETEKSFQQSFSIEDCIWVFSILFRDKGLTSVHSWVLLTAIAVFN